MSKSRLDEMSEVLAELKTNSKTIDAAIAETEYRLSLLRGIRQATKTGDTPTKPRAKAVTGSTTDKQKTA